MITPPEKSDPARQVVVDVEGPRSAELVDDALRQAAVFLREQPDDLYASNVGQIRVTQRSKYRKHLGVQGHPIKWACTVTVRLHPDVVAARRGEDPDKPPPRRPGRRRGHLHQV